MTKTQSQETLRSVKLGTDLKIRDKQNHKTPKKQNHISFNKIVDSYTNLRLDRGFSLPTVCEV